MYGLLGRKQKGAWKTKIAVCNSEILNSKIPQCRKNRYVDFQFKMSR